MAPYFLRQIVSFYALFLALSLHKFLISCRMPSATFSSSSQFSFVDSVRSPPQYSSSSFRIHPDFISRAMISPPRTVLFHDFLRAIIFSPSHLPSPYSRPTPHLLQRLRALQRASDLTLSSYVSSILYPRHLSSRRPRALFLLSEGHWNRIKLYAGFSMPPFPPVAMKGGIRHGGRSGRRKMGRSHLNRGRTKFPWPLIKRPDAERRLRKRGRRLQSDW